MELEKTLKMYRMDKRRETNIPRQEKTYRGISILEERSFSGGTSIKYWM